MITVNDFISRALWVAKKLNTVYALGMWGWQISPETVQTKARQYPDFYTPGKIARLNSLTNTWGFDCVCLIKSILWGFGADLNDIHGGAIYRSNGVPDFGADSINKHCTIYTTDFSIIQPGAMLHCPGHVGIYIGGGLAVECTNAWESKVMITAVANLGRKSGYHNRTWSEWGLLKYIDYTGDSKMEEKIKELKNRIKVLEDLTEKPLHVYHYWSEIETALPWAYKPLRALYEAKIFSGDSPADLNITREKIECLVSLANACKRLGLIKY